MKKSISFADLQQETIPPKEKVQSPGYKKVFKAKPSPATQKPRKKFHVGSFLIDLLFLALLAAALVFFLNPDPNKYIFGYRAYFVQTSSMEPELPVGSVIIIHEAAPHEIQVGDDITVSTDDEEHEYITHRVVEVLDNYNDSGEPAFVTQGVAQSYPDEDVRLAGQVIGKVQLCIPWIGYILGFIQTHWLECAVCLIAVIGLIVFMQKTWTKPPQEEAVQAEDDSAGQSA